MIADKHSSDIIETATSMVQAIPRPVKTYHTTTYPRLAHQSTGFEGKGKTVLITGGATGIGFATAKSFAKAGVERIAIVSRSTGPQETARRELESLVPGVKIETFSASLTDYTRMSEILHQLQRIDILVLSAFGSHDFTPVQELSTSGLRECFETNVFAHFDLIKTFLSLEGAESKTVLAISTVAAQQVLPGLVGYGSSKAALWHVVQHFADAEERKSEGEKKAKFVSYHPGVIYTPAAAKVLPPEAEKGNWEDVNLPADFAGWLAGPQSDFLRGRFVWAEWDVDELIALKERVEKEPGFLKLGLGL